MSAEASKKKCLCDVTFERRESPSVIKQRQKASIGFLSKLIRLFRTESRVVSRTKEQAISNNANKRQLVCTTHRFFVREAKTLKSRPQIRRALSSRPHAQVFISAGSAFIRSERNGSLYTSCRGLFLDGSCVTARQKRNSAPITHTRYAKAGKAEITQE